VLLLDGAGRILLFRFVKDPKRPRRGHGWVTPGGGVHDGEPLHVAAARELREETGLAVCAHDLGPPIAVSTGYADLGWARGVFRDDYFYYRVDAHDVDTTGFEALERRHHAGHRWWTLDELTGTTETVYPFGLVPLISDLLADHIPQEPVRLPWHH